MTSAWTMDFNGPRATLPVSHKGAPIGTVSVVFTSDDHVAVTAMSDATASRVPHHGDIVFRGTHWYVSIGLYAASGWTEDNGDPESRWHRHQFTAQQTSQYGKTIAPSYRAAIVAGIREAVTAFIAGHPEVLTAAERNRLERELASALKTETAARAALIEASDAVNGITAALDRLAVSQESE